MQLGGSTGRLKPSSLLVSLLRMKLFQTFYSFVDIGYHMDWCRICNPLHHISYSHPHPCISSAVCRWCLRLLRRGDPDHNRNFIQPCDSSHLWNRAYRVWRSYLSCRFQGSDRILLEDPILHHRSFLDQFVGSQIFILNVLPENTCWTSRLYDLVESRFCIHSTGLP